jgi:hypothetical protein
MKKGDISAATLVGIILLVMGFGIVLMFYYRLSNTDIIDRQVCEESVILRATASGLTGTAAESFVNLVCRSQKICITSGLIGGNCKNFENEKATKVKVKNENAVARAIADEVLACWDMMGQGRLSLFSPGWKSNFGIGQDVVSSCVICSRIAFDQEALKNINLSNVDLYDYMLRYKVPGKEFSYAETMAQGSPAGVSVAGREAFENLVNDVTAEVIKQEGENVSVTPVEQVKQAEKSGELAVVFMQISAPNYKDVMKNSGVALLSGGLASNFLFPGAPGVIAKIGVKAVSAFPIASAAVVIGALGFQGWNTYQNYQTAAGHCGDVKFETKDSYGCTAVRVIPYESKNLKEFCGVIESIS